MIVSEPSGKIDQPINATNICAVIAFVKINMAFCRLKFTDMQYVDALTSLTVCRIIYTDG